MGLRNDVRARRHCSPRLLLSGLRQTLLTDLQNVAALRPQMRYIARFVLQPALLECFQPAVEVLRSLEPAGDRRQVRAG